MTVYSVEGFIVVMIIYALSIGLCVFYVLWRKTEAKLRAYYHSEEDEWKTRMINPTADRIPRMCGHIDPSTNANELTNPTTAPPSRAKAILPSIISLIHNCIKGVSINKE